MITVLNEFIAYRQLGQLIADGQLSERSIVVATYALCGFANPGSMGVQIATLSAMAPQRKSDFARVAFRAFISGSAACFKNSISSVNNILSVVAFVAKIEIFYIFAA